jgi:hypothetical protein
MLSKFKSRLAGLPLGVCTVAGLNLISFVGKHRESILSPVVDTLVRFYHDHVSGSPADKHNINCVVKALRSGLLGIIKRSPTLIDWNALLIDALDKICALCFKIFYGTFSTLLKFRVLLPARNFL